MYIFLNVCIPKSNLFSLYDVIGMCVCRADYLALNNQLVCSSLGRAPLLLSSFLSCLESFELG